MRFAITFLYLAMHDWRMLPMWNHIRPRLLNTVLPHSRHLLAMYSVIISANFSYRHVAYRWCKLSAFTNHYPAAGLVVSISSSTMQKLTQLSRGLLAATVIDRVLAVEMGRARVWGTWYYFSRLSDAVFQHPAGGEMDKELCFQKFFMAGVKFSRCTNIDLAIRDTKRWWLEAEPGS